MPWKETHVMDQKMEMVGDYLSERYGVTQLSEIYGVSRKTIYKWLWRYKDQGPLGLEERSRAPRSHPNATPPGTAREVVGIRMRYSRWGPKKIVAWLEQHYPESVWPAPGTAGEILKRAGLVSPRRRRRKAVPQLEPLRWCDRPNAVWSADFKGQFRTGDGQFCYPLTISDSCSRFLLVCQALHHPTLEEVQPWFEWAFQQYGLPDAIRTDNGHPFASLGIGGLSRLSAWFVKLGISPERIEAGHPEQNGRHERLHRSLKEATARPPRNNMEEQQQAFDEFTREYNFQRPHEALGQKTPASVYQPSYRPYPLRMAEVKYGDDTVVRRVRHNGCIKWQGKLIYVSEALIGELVGLRQMGECLWELSLGFYHLGILNDRTGKINPLVSRKGGEVLPMCPV